MISDAQKNFLGKKTFFFLPQDFFSSNDIFSHCKKKLLCREK